MIRRTLLSFAAVSALGTGLPQLTGQDGTVHAQELQRSERAWLGVLLDVTGTIAPLTREQSTSIFVQQVEAGGPAYLGGLRPGDRIIGVSGQEISLSDWYRTVEALRPGQDLRVRVSRVVSPDGQRQEQEVVIVAGARPTTVRVAPVMERIASAQARLMRSMDSLLVVVSSGQAQGNRGAVTSFRLRIRTDQGPVDSLRVLAESLEDELVALSPPPLRSPAGPQLRRTTATTVRPRSLTPYLLSGPYVLGGARAQAVEGRLADYFGVQAGVAIMEVVRGSPAAQMGLRPGDVIVAVDGSGIATLTDLDSALTGRDRPKSMNVIRQGGLEVQLIYPNQ